MPSGAIGEVEAGAGIEYPKVSLNSDMKQLPPENGHEIVVVCVIFNLTILLFVLVMAYG